MTTIIYCMGCIDCCRGLFFTILTLASIGIIVAALIAGIVITVKLQINEYYEWLLIGLIIASCVSVLLLIYGIYAALCGRKCSKTLVSVFYLIFSILCIAIGILLFAMKGKILISIGKVFGDISQQSGEPNNNVHALEDFFDCCAYDQKVNRCQEASRRNEPLCKKAIEDFYNSYGFIVAGVILSLGVLLFVLTIFAFRIACSTKEMSENEPVYTVPLTNGW